MDCRSVAVGNLETAVGGGVPVPLAVPLIDKEPPIEHPTARRLQPETMADVPDGAHTGADLAVGDVDVIELGITAIGAVMDADLVGPDDELRARIEKPRIVGPVLDPDQPSQPVHLRLN